MTASANEFAVATFQVIQGGKVLSRKVFVLTPGKKLKKPPKLLGGSKLKKGKFTLKASTFSVDGCASRSRRISRPRNRPSSPLNVPPREISPDPLRSGITSCMLVLIAERDGKFRNSAIAATGVLPVFFYRNHRLAKGLD